MTARDWIDLVESWRTQYANHHITRTAFEAFLTRNGYTPVQARAESYAVETEAHLGERVITCRCPIFESVYT